MSTPRVKALPTPQNVQRHYLETPAGDFDVHEILRNQLKSHVSEELGSAFDAWLVFQARDFSLRQRIRIERETPHDHDLSYHSIDGESDIPWRRMESLRTIRADQIRDSAPDRSGRWRALLGTGAFALLGLVGGLVLSYRLYQHYFVTEAIGVVTSDVVRITAAADGWLIPRLLQRGQKVQAGETLAVLESNALDLPAASIGIATATREDGGLTERQSQVVQRGVASPCDCVLARANFDSGYLVSRGDAVFTLYSGKRPPRIEVRLPQDLFGAIAAGSIVQIEISGDTAAGHAVVRDLRIESGALLATIIPERVLPLSSLGQPVKITLGEISWPRFG